MSLTPAFAPGLFTSRRSADLFVETRAQLADLQRQLGTGRRAETYGGLGPERRSSLDARGKMSVIESYQSAIKGADLRLKLMTQGLEQIAKDGASTKSDLLPVAGFKPGVNGRTNAQNLAEERLKLAIDVLNGEVDGRHYFSGRSVDQKPVESFDRIMNGDPDPAGPRGLKTLIDERVRAELGLEGAGRLDVTVGATDLRLTGNDPAIPFGFELLGASSTGSITTGFTAGPPADAQFTLTGVPADGDTVSLTLRDKGGTVHSVTLTARRSPDPNDPNSFAIGASVGATLANLNGTLQGKSKAILSAYAADVTAETFFAGTVASPPPRVSGVPETATALIAGTAANTVVWYKSDSAADPRGTAPVRIDETRSVGIGAQANEEGIRRVLAQFGALAATSHADTKAGQEGYENLAARVRDNLGQSSGETIADIAVDLGNAQAAMKSAKERHQATIQMLEDTLARIEQASPEETAAAILTLQTRLQASYQTTSILSQLSLVNYL
jgi:flagellar hook-associated protein 3 FlgL